MTPGTDSSNRPGLLERLAAGELLVLDGATGSYLQEHGLEPGGCPELMNAEHPDVVQEMARQYFAAGSDMVLTNTFGANRIGLARYDLEDRTTELNIKAVENARAGAPENGLLIGSVGPLGGLLEPLGDISEDAAFEALTEQMKALEQGGADGVVIETQIALEETLLGIRAAKEHTSLPVIATMVFDKGPRGYFTMMGVTPEKAVEELQNAGADIVGTNCGNGIERMVEIATQMRAVTDGYLIVQSNAGMPTLVKGENCYPETPEFMADGYSKLAHDLKVNILGGCCGTTAAHIKALVNAVKPQALSV